LTSERETSVVQIEGRRYALEPHSCFACGELSEHGLHLLLHADEVGTRTEVTLDPQFQGWDGIAHGGILCTILDEVQAWSVVARGGWGLTVRMAVEFHRPVPLGSPLRAFGEVTSVRHRRYETAGRIEDARTGRVLATGSATFIGLTGARADEIRARYRVRALDDPVATAAATEPAW
jgi:uncharacterized protein (TIGR00369 family)